MDIAQLKARYPDAETFQFGNSAEMSEWLLGLVRAGKKTATCEPLKSFTEGGEAMPKVGRRDIALAWDGTPALVIETLEIRIRRFRDVDEAFALEEGENDTLAGWQADHQAYFEKEGGFDPNMELVCERFRVVEDLAAS